MTAIVIAFPRVVRPPSPRAIDIDLARQRGRIDGRWCRHLTDGRTGKVDGLLRIGDGIFARLWRDRLHYDTVAAHLLAPTARSAPL